MLEIHCHTCGGFIAEPGVISYRQPSDATLLAAPHTGLCSCSPAIVYGPPPGYLSWPGLAMESVERSRAAARN